MSPHLEFKGSIIEVTPSTHKILNIFDPIIFPSEISLCFLNAAIADVASSGNEVPKATTLIPITTSDIPKNLAIKTAPSTKRSAPNDNATMPKTTNKIISLKLLESELSISISESIGFFML